MPGFYPYNPDLGQEIQTVIPGLHADLAFLAHYSWATPAAVSDTAVHAAVTLGTGVTVEVTTGITNPDYPRALRVKGNVAGITGNVVIEGTNIASAVITETIVASGASAVEGNKAFKTVAKITLPQRTTAGDTISIGYNDKLGLPYKVAVNTVLLAALNSTREATAPAVTVSATAIESNIVDLNSALAGTKVEVWMIV